MKNYQVTYQIKGGPKRNIEVKALNRLNASRSARINIAMRKEMEMCDVGICNIQQIGAVSMANCNDGLRGVSLDVIITDEAINLKGGQK